MCPPLLTQSTQRLRRAHTSSRTCVVVRNRRCRFAPLCVAGHCRCWRRVPTSLSRTCCGGAPVLDQPRMTPQALPQRREVGRRAEQVQQRAASLGEVEVRDVDLVAGHRRVVARRSDARSQWSWTPDEAGQYRTLYFVLCCGGRSIRVPSSCHGSQHQEPQRMGIVEAVGCGLPRRVEGGPEHMSLTGSSMADMKADEPDAHRKKDAQGSDWEGKVSESCGKMPATRPRK